MCSSSIEITFETLSYHQAIPATVSIHITLTHMGNVMEELFDFQYRPDPTISEILPRGPGHFPNRAKTIVS